jgi:hypothetical protein
MITVPRFIDGQLYTFGDYSPITLQYEYIKLGDKLIQRRYTVKQLRSKRKKNNNNDRDNKKRKYKFSQATETLCSLSDLSRYYQNQNNRKNSERQQHYSQNT